MFFFRSKVKSKLVNILMEKTKVGESYTAEELYKIVKKHGYKKNLHSFRLELPRL